MGNPFNIDWQAIKRYTSPQAVKDFDAFLDALPLNVGYNALIAAGIAWIVAGATVFFTATEVGKVSSLRAEMAKVEALKPPIPIIQYIPVSVDALKPLEKRLSSTYKGINFTDTGGSVTVSAQDTDYFPQFLAVINTLQNGGKNWRVSIDQMCIGRDCPAAKLVASLKVEMARVGEPPKEEEKESDTTGK